LSTVILFGATGAAGSFLLPQLLARGARVYAVSRQPPPATAPTPVWIRADLFAAPLPVPADTEIALSLGPLDAFAAWIEQAQLPRLRCVVALSSMSAQSKRDSVDAHERELAGRLRAAEARLLQLAAGRAFACTLLRPTLIYGGRTDRSLAPIVAFVRRWRLLPIPTGAHGLRQPIHAADLAAAVLAVIDCAPAAGKIYALGGGERLAFDQLLRRLAAALPGPVLPLPLPRWLLRLLSALGAGGFAPSAGALQRLGDDLVADDADARRDFGFSPRPFTAEDVVAPRPSPKNS